jgi:ubiquinone/menaquinone biosynthesis C-methylase UbiE
MTRSKDAVSRVLLGLALMVNLAATAFARSDDATIHETFDDVEHWRKVFDDPARDQWQKPRELIEALGVRPGMVVADLGAGTGYLSHHLADAVGAGGTVLAVETEPKLVVQLRKRAEEERTPNVVPILASPDNPRLPAGGVDLVIILDTYHHIDDRIAYARALSRALRQDGRVAIVDWQKRELPVGPPPDHKLAREQVIDEMRAAGWSVAQELDVLPYQYVLVFRWRLASK